MFMEKSVMLFVLSNGILWGLQTDDPAQKELAKEMLERAIELASHKEQDKQLDSDIATFIQKHKPTDMDNKFLDAAEKSETAEMKEFVRLGAHVDVRDGLCGWPALVSAAQKGNIKTIRCLLLDLHADVNRTTEKGLAPVVAAAMHGHKKTVKFLLAQGANVDRATTAATPYQWATNRLASTSEAADVKQCASLIVQAHEKAQKGAAGKK